MTLDDWGDFVSCAVALDCALSLILTVHIQQCLDKTNGAADKSVLLEEADFFVQQMLFLGEDVFLNSTINKALVSTI